MNGDIDHYDGKQQKLIHKSALSELSASCFVSLIRRTIFWLSLNIPYVMFTSGIAPPDCSAGADSRLTC
jgi:hypothetical protein